MVITSASSIYFSPTGTTKKVINAIVKGMRTTNNTSIDLTYSDVRNILFQLKKCQYKKGVQITKT